MWNWEVPVKVRIFFEVLFDSKHEVLEHEVYGINYQVLYYSWRIKCALKRTKFPKYFDLY